MSDKSLFLQGGTFDRLNKKELFDALIDVIDVSLYKKLKIKFENPTESDLKFDSNENFWKNVLSNKAYPSQYITLSNFYLTEWLPMSPGLYHTGVAKEKREYAERFAVGVKDNWFMSEVETYPHLIPTNLIFQDRTPLELSPRGKMSMVLGGIGSLRLEPKSLFNKETFFILGATSSGVSHEGIPVILSKHSYQKYIGQIKENCGLLCNLTGRLEILPTEDLPIKYDRNISKYCLFVEEISNTRKSKSEDILVSVAITYCRSLTEFKDKQWSFVSFVPDKYDDRLSDSVNWLSDYARRYSNVNNPIVLADFDGFKQHFEKCEFSVKDLAEGKIDFEKLAKYEDFLNFKINIMGSVFSNISGSTIINESTITNAFNKVKEDLGEDTAKALAQVADHVEKSGNKEAGEVFNAFSEELQKPTPQKSLLKAFWSGLTSTLPTILSIAEVAEKISKIIG